MATYYWVGGNGTWDNASKTNWATVSGGAGGNGPPISGDIVNFDANSGTAPVVTVAATAVCTTCTINKSDVNLSLSGSPTFAGGTTLSAGTLTLNDNTLTVQSFSASSSTARTIAFGTSGKIVITGNNLTAWTTSTPTNFTYTGTSNITLSYSGSTGTRAIVTGSSSVAQALNFNITGGADIINFSSTNSVLQNLIFSGFTGTLTNTNKYITGNVTFSSGMTVTGGTSPIIFYSVSSAQLLTTAGITLDFPITIGATGYAPVVTLQDDLTVGSTRAVTLTNGTLNANDKNVSLGTFALGSGTKTLTLGSGTWTVSGSGTAWNANTNVSGLTVSASTATISMTSGSVKTFAGGGKTWPTLNQGGSGALTIQQSNTFTNITNTVQPATVTLTSGTTQTVSSFTLGGTAGNLITLNSSSAGSQATLSDSSGSNSVSYVSLKDIVATGGALWRAYLSNGNVNGGNNIGWDFYFDATVYTRRKSKIVYLR